MSLEIENLSNFVKLTDEELDTITGGVDVAALMAEANRNSADTVNAMNAMNANRNANANIIQGIGQASKSRGESMKQLV